MVIKRWTDEMLDELASSVTELREGITDVKDSIDGLRITSQALLQVAGTKSTRYGSNEGTANRIGTASCGI